MSLSNYNGNPSNFGSQGPFISGMFNGPFNGAANGLSSGPVYANSLNGQFMNMASNIPPYANTDTKATRTNKRRQKYKYKQTLSSLVDEKQNENKSFIKDIFSKIWPWGRKADKDIKGGRYKSSSSKTEESSFTKTPEDPAVVFFPTNQDSECMDGSAGGGFNTFGFLAMMLAGFNLIGVVSNNGNQNNDNNNNDNNDNNNNNQQVNIANTPSEVETNNMVIAVPLPPGRMLDVEYRKYPDIRYKNDKTKEESKSRRKRAEGCKQGLSSFVALELLRAWLRLVVAEDFKSEPGNSECRQRIICELNHDASNKGVGSKHAVEVGTFLLIGQLPFSAAGIQQLVTAAREGRAVSQLLNQAALERQDGSQHLNKAALTQNLRTAGRYWPANSFNQKLKEASHDQLLETNASLEQAEQHKGTGFSLKHELKSISAFDQQLQAAYKEGLQKEADINNQLLKAAGRRSSIAKLKRAVIKRHLYEASRVRGNIRRSSQSLLGLEYDQICSGIYSQCDSWDELTRNASSLWLPKMQKN